MELPHDTEQVLIGSLLGDGCLRLNKKAGCVNAHYYEGRSAKNEEYAHWKANFLMSLGVKCTKRRRFYRYLRGHRTILEIRSRSLPILTDYHRIFYPKGRKVVPPDALENLEELGIATWHCDDGSYAYSYSSQRTICWCTQAFSHNENLIIKNWFSRRWGINPKINQDGGGKYRLWFNQQETAKLVKLIEKFVPESMRYKLGGDKERLATIQNKLREFYLINRGKLIECTIAWQKRNPEKMKKYRRNYRIKHRERLKQYDINRYMTHRERSLRRRGNLV